MGVFDPSRINSFRSRVRVFEKESILERSKYFCNCLLRGCVQNLLRSQGCTSLTLGYFPTPSTRVLVPKILIRLDQALLHFMTLDHSHTRLSAEMHRINSSCIIHFLALARKTRRPFFLIQLFSKKTSFCNPARARK